MFIVTKVVPALADVAPFLVSLSASVSRFMAINPATPLASDRSNDPFLVSAVSLTFFAAWRQLIAAPRALAWSNADQRQRSQSL
jgi:hypothetical protein